MELSEKKINELYRFVEHKSVKFYDLQTELVDHLADDIENTISKDTTIDFFKAKQIAFQKFGVFGFSNIVREKEKQMGRKYLKLLFLFAKEWLTPPKLIASIGCVFSFYILLFQNVAFYTLYILDLCLISISFYKLFSFKKKLKKHQKKWMLEHMIFKGSIAFFIIILGYSINLLSSPLLDTLLNTKSVSATIRWQFLAFAIFKTLEIISFVIILFIIPKKSNKILNSFYPNYQTT